jgi:hypothetical protein
MKIGGGNNGMLPQEMMGGAGPNFYQRCKDDCKKSTFPRTNSTGAYEFSKEDCITPIPLFLLPF